MLFAIHCEDGHDSAASRRLHYAAHRAYLGSTRGVRVLVAGPLVGDRPDQYIGSLFIVEADSLERARRFNSEDPFAVQGVWVSVRVAAFVMATDALSGSSQAPTPAPSSSSNLLNTGATS